MVESASAKAVSLALHSWKRSVSKAWKRRVIWSAVSLSTEEEEESSTTPWRIVSREGGGVGWEGEERRTRGGGEEEEGVMGRSEGESIGDREVGTVQYAILKKKPRRVFFCVLILETQYTHT